MAIFIKLIFLKKLSGLLFIIIYNLLAAKYGASCFLFLNSLNMLFYFLEKIDVFLKAINLKLNDKLNY